METNEEDAFVLHDGSAIIVYYAPLTSEEKIKTAKSLAAYIANFEETKYGVFTPISELG